LGEKVYLDDDAIAIRDKWRQQYGRPLSESDLLRILDAKAQDMDRLLRDKRRAALSSG
jgi:hypothetical protein